MLRYNKYFKFIFSIYRDEINIILPLAEPEAATPPARAWLHPPEYLCLFSGV
jgi:hypothetical protein